RMAFHRGIDKVGWKLASRMVANNRLDQAEEMLGRSAAAQSTGAQPDIVTLRNFAAMARLRGTLNNEREQWDKGLNGATGTDGFIDEKPPDGPAANMVAVFLAKAAGDFPRAATLGQKLPPTPWGEMVLFDAGRWGELAKMEAPPARPGVTPDVLHQAAKKMVL